MIFRDREQAARLLEEILSDLRGENPLVLGIPRGAVPMAKIIADALEAELDILLVHKITLAEQPEYAIGAVSEEGNIFLGDGAEHVPEDTLAEAAEHEIDRLQTKRRLFTPGRRAVDVRERTIILVDDGIATGATAIAGIRNLLENGAKRVIVAAPVISSQALARLQAEGAEVRALSVPEAFFAVSQFYEHFTQVDDPEVIQVLQGEPPEIVIRQDGLELKGYLDVPDQPKALVIFAHGSGSGRESPRNRFVAQALHERGFATLLADLLMPAEASGRERVFDIEFLSRRLCTIAKWATSDTQLARLPLCFFGASTGAAAALKAATTMGNERVSAVVSRGGRPDLAWDTLATFAVPTLLIVGEQDQPTLAQTREAFTQMNCEKQLVIVPGASHLFEEQGALERVAELAGDWFAAHLDSKAQADAGRSLSS